MEKEQFIKGKWYKFHPYEYSKKSVWYLKYESINSYIIASEYIDDRGFYCGYSGHFTRQYWEKENTYKEISSISEIAQYLPHDHPDLINSSSLLDNFQLF